MTRLELHNIEYITEYIPDEKGNDILVNTEDVFYENYFCKLNINDDIVLIFIKVNIIENNINEVKYSINGDKSFRLFYRPDLKDDSFTISGLLKKLLISIANKEDSKNNLDMLLKELYGEYMYEVIDVYNEFIKEKNLPFYTTNYWY